MKSVKIALINAALILVITFLLLLPTFAFAQEVVPSWEEILKQGLGVLPVWKASGAIAGLIALVNLCVNLSKTSLGAKFLGSKFWLRPLWSMLAAFFLACLGTLATGSGLGAGLIAGLLAGLGNIGFHELWTAFFNARVQTERALGSKIMEAIKITDSSAKVQVDNLREELARIATISTMPERLAALAALANKE